MAASFEHISKVGQIIHPVFAETLGRAVLAYGTEQLKTHDERLDNSLILESLQCTGVMYDYLGVAPAFNERAIEQMAFERFRELLIERKSPNPNAPIKCNYILGNIGWGSWHRDPYGERLLIDLATLPQLLRVALTWNQEADQRLNTCPEPLTHTTLTAPTGTGIYLDNRHQNAKRQPHAGLSTPGKVYMRLTTQV